VTAVGEIEGVKITPLRKIADERGAVFHMLRNDSPVFEAFGEIYFSMVYPGVIKAWHLHTEMTLNYAVPTGMIKLVCYDDRPDSPTKGEIQELFIGDLNYVLVTVPPLVWNGFKGVGAQPALVANCATIPHRPDEIERLDPLQNDIPYDWSLKHG
jgi:dTDP-4-dehydrorhamnose 3,5-epimerase